MEAEQVDAYNLQYKGIAGKAMESDDCWDMRDANPHPYIKLLFDLPNSLIELT